MERKSHWKDKLNGLLDTCQVELKRTAKIGKKMLTAGKENSQLNEVYEELGKKTYRALEEGTLTWDDPQVKETRETISALILRLEQIESEMQDIKESK